MTVVIVLFILTILMVVGSVVYWRIVFAKYTLPASADEFHYARTSDGWKIRLCRYRPEGEPGEPVLLCHGAVGNQFNFALPEGASTVESLVAAGFDCWALDFRGTRSSVPPEGESRWSATIEGYVLEDAPAAIAYIKRRTGHTKVHWVGHSLGAIVLYAYDQVFGNDEVASAVNVGGPPGFKGVKVGLSPVLFFLAKVMPSIAGIFVRLLSPIFDFVKPPRKHFPIEWENAHPDFNAKGIFNLFEAMSYPALRELESMGTTNSWRLGKDKIDVFSGLGTLRIPHFAIFAAKDPFVPVANAEEFFDKLEISDKQMVILSLEDGYTADYGHVDLLFGKNCREEVYAPIVDWLERHPITGQQAETPVKRAIPGAGNSGPREGAEVVLKTSLEQIVAAKKALSQLESSVYAPSVSRRVVGKDANRKGKSRKKKPAAKKTSAKTKMAAKKVAAKKKTAAKKSAPKRKASTKKKSKRKSTTRAKTRR